MQRKTVFQKSGAPLLAASLLITSLIFQPIYTYGAETPQEGEATQDRVEALLQSLTLDQKISQMIMPSIRSWEGENVTDLSQVPELSQILARHPYGGIILFGQNVVSTEQTFNLVNDLQESRAVLDSQISIPYLMAADQEGGIVTRLSMGTRGTGSMALGAAGEKGEENAYITGQIFGDELSALGFNVNLGPCLDVILDPADFGMSTRIFSDDPEVAARLGIAFARGVEEGDVITTYKHFPGAGDGSDDPTSIPLTLEELEEAGLYAYRAGVQAGAEMIMISATTFPFLDEPHLMADGVTEGYYPATLSKKIVTELLREDLGYQGVIITDALEMVQFVTEPDNGAQIFTGELGTLEHDLQVAQGAILAGCDILLIPKDLITLEAGDYYEGYIQGLVSLVEQGVIPEESIDASVRRILTLKQSHGLLDYVPDSSPERLEEALERVGSPQHHSLEFDLAKDAITLLRNEGEVLPLTSEGKYMILASAPIEHDSILYALRQLKEKGIFDSQCYIEDRMEGSFEGSPDSPTAILVDTYRDMEIPEGESGGLKEDLQGLNALICLSKTGTGIDQLQDENPRIQELLQLRAWAKESQIPFIVLSESLPVDITRLQDADAFVCAYLASRAGQEGEEVFSGSANVPTALYAIFGAEEMPGHLPVNIPALEQGEDGSWAYTDTLLYERGFSLPLPTKEEPDFVRDRVASEITKSASEPSRQVETGFLEEPDFVRGCEAGEVTKSASEPSQQVETGFLEE